MGVEGILIPSADTEAGSHVHRRVDKPSKSDDEESEPEDVGRPKVLRSLAIAYQRKRDGCHIVDIKQLRILS